MLKDGQEDSVSSDESYKPYAQVWEAGLSRLIDCGFRIIVRQLRRSVTKWSSLILTFSCGFPLYMEN